MPPPDASDLVLDYEGAGHRLRQAQDELARAVACRDDLHGKMIAMLRRNGVGGVVHDGLRYFLKDGRVTTEPAPIDVTAAILPGDDAPAGTPADLAEPGDDPSGADEFTANIDADDRSGREKLLNDAGTPAPPGGKGAHRFAAIANLGAGWSAT